MASQHNPFPNCNPEIPAPRASYRSPPYTPRHAIDSHARLASFYDATCDQVITHVSAHLPSQSILPAQNVSCFMKTDLSEARLNLLESIKMHDDLRLSLALQMTPATGIGTLINYSPSIDTFTRMLCYTTITRTEHLPDEDLQRLLEKKEDQQEVAGTHVVIFINYGIDAVVLLQLPTQDQQLVKDIDQILNQLCTILSCDEEIQWRGNQESVLRQITHTQVFSNMACLTEYKSIIDFYHNINRVRLSSRDHPPCHFNLCPITNLFSVNDRKIVCYEEIVPSSAKRIELHMLLLSREMKILEGKMQQTLPLCQKYRKDLLESVKMDWDEIKQMHRQEVHRLAEWVKKARMTEVNHSQIDQLSLDDAGQKILRKIESLWNRLEQTLIEKETILAEVEERKFEYRQAANYGLQTDEDETRMIQKLRGHEINLTCLCGTDQLINEQHPRWMQLCDRAVKERESFANRRVAYYDFTDHAYPLSQLIMSSSEENETEKNEIVNILLLGESGVGKSTFINSLVNYLRCKTFEDADRKDPIVLLPISFIVTSGANFDEHSVVYPGIDDGSEEMHDQPGQSVTQHCRSYLFAIKCDDQRERKVRLIDTPGFGDSRGLDHDEKNMDEIMAFIQGLDRLHAVCMMMRPNVTRLQTAFRSRFTQMVDLLAADGADHVIFCFTNSRATFYTPGGTSLILRKLLESLKTVKIQLKKENTFCFDSESFRYLVAKKAGITFDSSETDQYKESWNRSWKTSKCFFETIFTRKKGYKIYDDQQSSTMAKFKIHRLIRPLLEVIRNLLRNIILREKNPTSQLIELRPQAIENVKLVYHRCREHKKTFAEFQVLEDSCDPIHDGCTNLKLDHDDFINIQYCLNYEVKDGDKNSKKQDLKQVDEFLDACVAFASFLLPDDSASKSDRIGLQWRMMIHEEEILAGTGDNVVELNRSLYEELKKFREKYERDLRQKRSLPNPIDLKSVFTVINSVSADPMIESQLKEIKEWQKRLVIQGQYSVEIPELLSE